MLVLLVPRLIEQTERIMPESDTRAQLLDIALELVQTRGYNAFSFYDLADRVGIKTASIHYHFPTKGDLGVALIRRYRQLEAEAFAQFDKEPDTRTRLRHYAGLFRSLLETNYRMCLAGILAIDCSTLPPLLVEEVKACFDDNERWLALTLAAGRQVGELVFDPPADVVARSLFAALEGAMLSARLFGDFDRFDTAAAWHLAQLSS